MTKREREVYDWLMDEESREIFTAYNDFVGDHRTWEFSMRYSFPQISNRIQGLRYAVYGVGAVGKRLVRDLDENNQLCNCIGIWDSHPEFCCVPGIDAVVVWPPVAFDADVEKPDLVLVSTSVPHYAAEMAEVCRSLNIEYICVGDLGVEDCRRTIFLNDFKARWESGCGIQYLDKNIVMPRLSDNEVIVDGGSYDFKTMIEFMRVIPNVQRIYSFEPDSKNIELAKDSIDRFGMGKVKLFNAALHSHKCKLNFMDSTTYFAPHNQGSSITDRITGVEVEACAVDDVIPGEEKVTFIKMDVEGSELEALKGARNTIVRCKPKLAISVYHQPQDYIEIPLFVKSLVPEYKMYLRHESNAAYDTVAYFVI
jgi:FkbM family methyltransferase